VTQYLKGQAIGHGTGFLVDFDDRLVLVTNYHVVTARNPEHPAAVLPGYPDSPDELGFLILRNEDGRLIPQEVTTPVALGWVEHPDRAKGVDLVAYPIGLPPDARPSPLPIDFIRAGAEHPLRPGEDVLIVGFPFSELVDDFLPVWKRGSVATEPIIGHRQLPRYLIDALSKEGMSGSPVYAVERDRVLDADEEVLAPLRAAQAGEMSALDALVSVDPSALNKWRSEDRFRFAGVYSGRIGLKDGGDLALGIAQRIDAVLRVLEDGVVADHPYPPFEDEP
jgi:hypothetical protein